MSFEPMQAIYIPYGEFLNLELHLIDTRPGIKAKELVVELVKRWLAADKERLALLKAGPSMRGYQWKNVFLPSLKIDGKDRFMDGFRLLLVKTRAF